MNLNDIDGETEQKLQDILEEDEVASNIRGIVNFLRKIKAYRGLSDDEIENLSYMVINKLSFEIDTWLTGYYQDEEKNEKGE